MSSTLTPPWKISFNPLGQGPYLVEVKLADLMYSQYASSPPTPWASNTGFSLLHDILVYNPAAYDSLGNIAYEVATAPDYYSVNLPTRKKYGIFLIRPNYSPLAHSQTISYSLSGTSGLVSGSYTKYEDGASEELQEDAYFGENQAGIPNVYNYAASLQSSLDAADFFASSISAAQDGTGLANTCGLILTNPDNTLQASLPGSQLVPFTKVRINLGFTSLPNLVAWATGVDVTSPEGLALSQTPGFIDPTQNPALRDAVVWFRCAYFADYVEPDTFEQDLTQVDPVQHQNLIIGTGSYTKYQDSASDDTPAVEPYIPLTPPLNNLVPAPDPSDLSAAFPIPARTTPYPSAADNIPVGWYDPTDSTRDGLPSVPVEGNGYFSGRLFSPTIDEIFLTLKELISGRPTDPNTLPVTEDASGIYSFPASTTASKKTITDTRLPAENAYSLPSSKLGDPVNRTGSSFVNIPEGIFYYIGDRIKVVADAMTNITGAQIEDVAPFAALALKTSGFWAPRSKPYSLRELEALLMGVSYNLESVFNFLVANKASVGGVSGSNGSYPYGTLHQLHVGFNNSPAASDANSEWTAPSNTNIPEDYTNYGNELPQGGAQYAPATDHLREDVYLAADGTWRYLFDTVRVPVLTETY